MSRCNPLTPDEIKVRRAAYGRARYADPETRERILAYTNAYNARPENKERAAIRKLKRDADPEIQARDREVKKARWARPEVQARGRAGRYGLSVQELDQLLAAGCVAARLGAGERCKGQLHIDHDHGCCNRVGSCGECVRGALCVVHNTSLGGYEESLLWAGTYLAQYASKREGGTK